MAKFVFELFPEYAVYLQLYEGLENAKELRSSLKYFECALLNPGMVCSVQHVLSAANRALYHFTHSIMKTRDIYSEITYYLSPSKNINDALKRFGINDTSKACIVVTYNADVVSYNQLEMLEAAVIGRKAPLQNLTEHTNFEEIKNYFGISDGELSIDRSLTNAIYSTLAIKDL